MPDGGARQDRGVMLTTSGDGAGHASVTSVIGGEPDVTRTCRFVAV